MQRIVTPPRADWQEKVEEYGLTYHTIDDELYWDESACYSFSSSEIDELETATAELQEMCIAAAEHVITNKLYEKLQIPPLAVPLIERSWENDDPSILGRFDLAYDGHSPPKMLEYNADTPTALLEASVIQWFWLKERFPDADQFNSIHEKLIEAWTSFQPDIRGTLYFSCVKNAPEDLGNLEYLRDTAIQAGLQTEMLFIEDIGYDSFSKRFVDTDNTVIEHLFKLYPWEWLLYESFGRYIETSCHVAYRTGLEDDSQQQGDSADSLGDESAASQPAGSQLRSGAFQGQFRQQTVSVTGRGKHTRPAQRHGYRV